MESQSFDSIKFFHVLRINNKESDSLANQALQLQDGILLVNDSQTFKSIPWLVENKRLVVVAE
jgi:hypothetical protein